jgi:hypothetical protein
MHVLIHRSVFLLCFCAAGYVPGWAQLSQADTFALPSPFFVTKPDTIQFNNGKRYIGQVMNGKLEGRGLLLNPGGDTLYRGEFEDNKKHGLGRYYFTAGNVYTGYWRDNRMHGQGRMSFYTGDRYEGSWFDDRFHGQGLYTFADSSTYQGNFFEGKRHGQGTLTTESMVYSGQWTNGLKEGTGKHTVIFPTHREVFEGTFHQDVYDGQGVWRMIKGDQVMREYEGTFVAGKRQGEGIYRIGGRTLYGTWQPDAITTQAGQGRSEAGTYEGPFVNGLAQGQGKFFYADESRYDGQWVRGKRQGQGKMIWADGQVYDGEWFADQPNGQGTLYLVNGKVRQGEFAKGEFIK